MSRPAWIAALLLAAAAAAPLATRAGDPAPPGAADPAANATSSYEAQKEAWQSRFRDARTTLARAEARYYEALDGYAAMRHRRRARGDAKEAIVTELAEAEVALDEAREALGALHEQARRAGIPPGWIRDAGGPPPADFAPNR